MQGWGPSGHAGVERVDCLVATSRKKENSDEKDTFGEWQTVADTWAGPNVTVLPG